MSDCLIEMPKYQCHKKVLALKIESVQATSTGGILYHDEPRFTATHVDQTYMEKHKPQVGGYYVCYKGGYKSFSPAAEFEDGYTRI
jgi:hypothetical protein